MKFVWFSSHLSSQWILPCIWIFLNLICIKLCSLLHLKGKLVSGCDAVGQGRTGQNTRHLSLPNRSISRRWKIRIDSILLWGIMEERCVPLPSRRERPEGTDTAVPVTASPQHTAHLYPWGWRGSHSTLALSSAPPTRVRVAPAGAATSVLLAAPSEEQASGQPWNAEGQVNTTVGCVQNRAGFSDISKWFGCYWLDYRKRRVKRNREEAERFFKMVFGIQRWIKIPRKQALSKK